jgi:predicted acyltransferase (DUF342 family)
MAFQPLSTSNTFSQWITDKQRAISVLNQFTDGSNASTFYANTSIYVGNNVTIGGNLNIGGFLILDSIGYKDLDVSGNVSIQGTTISENGVFKNLVITSNVATLNTITLNVGTNANLNSLVIQNTLSVGNIALTGDISGEPTLSVLNLTVTQNVERVNVSTQLRVGSDLGVYGNLSAFLNSTSTLVLSGDISLDEAIIDTLTVNTLIGQANTNIYNNIFSSNAFTSVQNSISEFLGFSTILG